MSEAEAHEVYVMGDCVAIGRVLFRGRGATTTKRGVDAGRVPACILYCSYQILLFIDTFGVTLLYLFYLTASKMERCSYRCENFILCLYLLFLEPL